MDPLTLKAFFTHDNCLARLCTQNGWPDPDTLQVEVVEKQPDSLVCSVSFEEVIMEGAGCIAGRISCWGRYRLLLGAQDTVLGADLMTGIRGQD